MAMDFWDQFPTTGGVTGQPYVDPSQLQPQPGVSLQNPAPTSPMLPGNGGDLGNTPIATTTSPGVLPPNQHTQMGGQMWDQNYFSTNFGTPRTPQELIALESKITAAGGKVLRNAAGVAGKIQTPDGRIIDVINSAGAGGNGFQWLEGGGGGGSQGNTLAGLGYSFGDSMQKFTPPTAEDALNSPGLQFALSEANRMGQNSAAAKGTLLNGRFQQALNASNIGNALQGYQGVYDRAFQTHVRNQDAPWLKQLSLAELGKPGA